MAKEVRATAAGETERWRRWDQSQFLRIELLLCFCRAAILVWQQTMIEARNCGAMAAANAHMRDDTKRAVAAAEVCVSIYACVYVCVCVFNVDCFYSGCLVATILVTPPTDIS